MPNILITNTTPENQTFEVHGWNNNQNITVKGKTTHTLSSPEQVKASGAIIALHDGHEGEQAEITFNGGDDLQYYDISVIVGAGGNLTIEQVGAPKTRKGDPTFMQDLRKAWSKASPAEKETLKGSVHLDEHGIPIRIEAPKFHESLEKFVRTFADDQVYIGVGAWGPSTGNPHDNDQSKATPGGNKSLHIVYSNAASPPDAHNVQPVEAEADPVIMAFQNGNVADDQTIMTGGKGDANGFSVQAAANGVVSADEEEKSPTKQPGGPHPAGPGVTVHNMSKKDDTYYFFNNFWNGNGTAGANFDHPEKPTHLHAGESKFVNLLSTFKGRVQRGKLQPATWVEFQLDADNNTGAWGDISLQQGCDGPAMIRATDHDDAVGFDHDILARAPPAAVVTRSDGVKVIAPTVDNGAGVNHAAVEYDQKAVGQKNAYIVGGTGTKVVNSKNGRLTVDFY